MTDDCLNVTGIVSQGPHMEAQVRGVPLVVGISGGGGGGTVVVRCLRRPGCGAS
jgi:hypothetical protein